MKLGAMNNPMFDPIVEIETYSRYGFDFIDLTLEPQASLSSTIPVDKVKDALERTGLGIIGHTAYYLPIASPFPELREAAIAEIERCIEIFARLGADRVNVHPYVQVPLHESRWIREMNIDAFRRLCDYAKPFGLRMMVENIPDLFNTPRELSSVFSAVPDLGFHLDVGHANLRTDHNQTVELASLFCERLLHVHFSDNNGGDLDLHMPIGSGKIDWKWIIHILKRVGYDDTITLEVFSDDREYLLFSKERVIRLWESDQ